MSDSKQSLTLTIKFLSLSSLLYSSNKSTKRRKMGKSIYIVPDNRPLIPINADPFLPPNPFSLNNSSPLSIGVLINRMPMETNSRTFLYYIP